MGLGSAAHTSLSISPLELEETVRRQLEQVLRDGQRGLAALQRWDGDGPDGDENVWKTVDGCGWGEALEFFLLFLE